MADAGEPERPLVLKRQANDLPRTQFDGVVVQKV